MARITLDANEEFEHQHDGPTTSTLVEGRAEMWIEGKEVNMLLNVPVEVPAHAMHRFRASSKGGAIICCCSCQPTIPPGGDDLSRRG